MTGPRPGRRVRGSKTGRPIMAAFDLLGRRWVLRVLWELRSAPHSFRSLQAACGNVSPAVLNTRLRELRDAGLVRRGEEGYAVTELGRQLIEALVPLDAWSKRWDRALGTRALEPGRRS
jgi:DNA-binding HxlR family transcriptional regulator